jgi:PAS domain S-box-containing protein
MGGMKDMSTKLRILHLEDNPEDVELVRETIAAQGIDAGIVDVATRADFINALEKEDYDLILADYTLPSFDGLSALAIARAKFPLLPFIFVTGTMGEEKAVETLKQGATDYVLKTHLTRLVTSIIRALREAEERIGRKKAQEALKESEERFRAVFDNAVDGILLADVENKIFHSGNSTICRMLGYSEKEITKLGVKDIHPEADLPFVVEQFEKQTRKEMKTAKDIPMKRKDGGVFYADINAFPVTLSEKTYLVGIFRDVTKRKHSEEALRDSEKRYRDIVENITDAMYMHDFKGNIIEVNENACKMLGYKREELIGANLSMLDSEENKRLLPERMNRLIKENSILFEGQHVRKDGRMLPVEISVKVVTREGSGIIQGFVRDISDRKKTDEEIRQRIQELEDFYEMAIGRELRMIELKEEIEKLKEELEKYQKD